jgi:hypothetical protein
MHREIGGIGERLKTPEARRVIRDAATGLTRRIVVRRLGLDSEVPPNLGCET